MSCSRRFSGKKEKGSKKITTGSFGVDWSASLRRRRCGTTELKKTSRRDEHWRTRAAKAVWHKEGREEQAFLFEKAIYRLH